MQKIASLILLTIALAWVAPADAGKLYKWVDEDGKVHYTDTPPPESSKQERDVLNQHGQITETLERQKTAEEIAAEEARKEQLRRQKEAEEAQAAKDRALLSTYTNVEQIEMAREGRVTAIESQINVVSSTIANLEERLSELEQQAAQIRNNDRPVPDNLQKRIEETRDELLNNQRYLMRKQGEREETRDKFNAEIERYKELRGEGNF